MKYKYEWWGKGDFDATLGLLFDGFSKVISAIGIMIFSFGMPADLVLGKITPAIGITVFLGNMWYFYEAKKLAEKECRSDVTAQPFGLGAATVSTWLFLIMGPIFWQSGDAMLAFRVGLISCFVGGLIEIFGAFIAKYIVKWIPKSALLGNLAAGAFIWITISSVILVFDKPLISVPALLIMFMGYFSNRKIISTKIPVGFISVALGTVTAWTLGYMSFDTLLESTKQIGFYMPTVFIQDLFLNFDDVIPYLPVILPLQVCNFLTTLQGLESAKEAGDEYNQMESMIMDGIFTVIGATLGNPFPTTVYYGHPGYKQLGARGGYSLITGMLYTLLTITGLTGMVMALIPYEVVLIILVFIGISVSTTTYKDTDPKYFPVIILSLIPLIIQYIQITINSVLQAVGTSIAEIDPTIFASVNIPINGIQILANGAIITSLLLSGWLAYIIDGENKRASYMMIILALFSFIGLIHNDIISLFTTQGTILGIIYIFIGIITWKENFLRKNFENK
ncbi:uracil permease [Candidatus Epulonipiscium fishelsonii]|nr:uracil permease [Epulopiscium sp. SCG-C06WGA-EpuloA1]